MGSYKSKLNDPFGDSFNDLVSFVGNYITQDFRILLTGFDRETVLQDIDFAVLTEEDS